MRAYWAVFSARFRSLLQYRAAALAGCGTQIFWGLIRMMILGAFYASTRAPQPMTYPEVVTYIWLGQATILLTIVGVDADVREMIRSGTVAYEMVRPVDLYQLWYARALARRIAPMLLRAGPILLLAALAFGLGPPASAGSAALDRRRHVVRAFAGRFRSRLHRSR